MTNETRRGEEFFELTPPPSIRSVAGSHVPRWRLYPEGVISENLREMEAFHAEAQLSEGPQNAADGRLDDSKPVRQRICIRRVPNHLLSKWIGDLRVHHKTCSEEEPRRYTHDFHDTDGLVMIFEDFNTTGLLGPFRHVPNSSDFPKNFVGLLLSSGDVVNKTASQLGSRGQGKITFAKASSAFCWFAYSVRIPHPSPNPEARVLMGRVRLQPHWISGVHYSKDGHWGVWNTINERLEPSPCTEDVVLDEFASDFGVIRQQDEPGTSIVVPHYTGTTEPAGLMFHLIERNYGLVNLNRIEFEVSLEEHGYQCKLHAGNIQEVVSEFANSTGDEKWTNLLVRIRRFAAMLSALDNPNAHIHLPKPERPMSFKRYLKSLPEDTQKRIVDDYEQSEIQVLRVAVEVEERREDRTTKLHSGELVLAIFKDGDSVGDYPEYFRDGLRIAPPDRTSMVRDRIAGHGAIVIVKGGMTNGLQMLLRASEPGAHDKWIAGNDKFKETWNHGKTWIDFAKDAPAELVEFVKGNTNTLNTLGFPFLTDPNPDERPDGNSPNSNDENGRGRSRRTRRPRPEPHPNNPQADITSHLHNGKNCVRVTLGGLTSRRLSIDAQYAREDGHGYDAADFDFEEMNSHGEILVPGGRVIEAHDNQLIVECDDQESFEVLILGFDIRRQPRVTVDSKDGES